MHLARDNQGVRIENRAAPVYKSHNEGHSDGFKAIEPIAKKSIVYERANANNTFSKLSSTHTPEIDPWTDLNNYKNDSIIPTVYMALGVPLVLMIIILIVVTLVALHKRYKRGGSRAPPQSISRPRVPEMDARHIMPQELATSSWAEYGISAREGTTELEGPNCQRVEMKARESVAQEMKARESVAKELEGCQSHIWRYGSKESLSD
ncbi:MAG: hypothetical protein Q9167_006869 [Letrouitia subvulpina]